MKEVYLVLVSVANLLVGVPPCFWYFEVRGHSVWGDVWFGGFGSVMLEAKF